MNGVEWGLTAERSAKNRGKMEGYGVHGKMREEDKWHQGGSGPRMGSLRKEQKSGVMESRGREQAPDGKSRHTRHTG